MGGHPALDSPVQRRKSCFPHDTDPLGHRKWTVTRMMRGLQTEFYESFREPLGDEDGGRPS